MGIVFWGVQSSPSPTPAILSHQYCNAAGVEVPKGRWWISWDVMFVSGGIDPGTHIGVQGLEFEFTLYTDSSGICDLFVVTWPGGWLMRQPHSLQAIRFTVNLKLKNTGKLERELEDVIWASSLAYILGPSIQIAARWTGKRNQRNLILFTRKILWLTQTLPPSLLPSSLIKDECK